MAASARWLYGCYNRMKREGTLWFPANVGPCLLRTVP